MKSILAVLGLTFSLIATPANAKESRNYWIGFVVTYVDLCAHFKGYTVDYLKIRDVRDKYVDDKEFRRGYKRERAVLGMDRITRGLTKCGEVIELLLDIHEELQISEAGASAGQGSSTTNVQQLATQQPPAQSDSRDTTTREQNLPSSAAELARRFFPDVGGEQEGRAFERAFMRFHNEMHGDSWELTGIRQIVVTAATEDTVELEVMARMFRTSTFVKKVEIRHFEAKLKAVGSRYSFVSIKPL